MNLKQILDNKIVKDVLLVFSLGILSFLLGNVRFTLMGLNEAFSDFREIPLIIALFYVRNPIYILGLSLITSLASPMQEGSYIVALIMHFGALYISGFAYQRIQKSLQKASILAAVWFFYVFVYYYMLMLPLMAITEHFFRTFSLSSIVDYYFMVSKEVWLEVLITAFVTSLFLMQHKIRKRLEEYQLNLEGLVDKRTRELTNALEDLKKTQANLIQSEKMASIGILTAGIAHEINNPLNYILGGYTGLSKELDEKGYEKTEKTNTLLEAIRLGVDHAAEIVKGLSQISRNNEKYNEKSDMHSIIDNCLTILHFRYNERIGIVKEYTVKNPVIYGNVGKLHQAFLNVLSNAIEAIDGKGRIKISTNRKENFFEIIIEDTGCGIPEDHLKKVTDPFFTTKEPGQGTGLGLSIANTIIFNHKGKLQIHSDVNKGTRVLIQMPVKA